MAGRSVEAGRPGRSSLPWLALAQTPRPRAGAGAHPRPRCWSASSRRPTRPRPRRQKLEGKVLLEHRHLRHRGRDPGGGGRTGRARLRRGRGGGGPPVPLHPCRGGRQAEPGPHPATPTTSSSVRWRWRRRPPPSQKAPVNLSGRVLERGTRRPVGGAEVALPSLGPLDHHRRRGGFSFRDVPPGQVPVVVTAAEYQRFDTTEIGAAGQGDPGHLPPARHRSAPRTRRWCASNRDKKEVSETTPLAGRRSSAFRAPPATR